MPDERDRSGYMRDYMKSYRATHPEWRANQAVKNRRRKRDRLDGLKVGKACMDCGVEYPPPVLQFDHRPGEVKEFDVSQGYGYSLERVLAEVAKCDLVCANCHVLRTMARRSPVVQR